jgi:hypothetical protein
MQSSDLPSSPGVPAPAPGRPAWHLPVVILGVVAVLVAGGGLAVMASPLGDSIRAMLGQSANSSVKLMPMETPLFIRLSPTGQQLKNVEALRARLDAIPEIKQALGQVDTSLAREQEITWATDIQPWLGPEIAIALTDARAMTAGRGAAPPMLALVATRDRPRSDAFLAKMRAAQEKRGGTMAEKQHGGVTYWAAAGGDTFFTTVGGFVVLATTEQGLRGTIDLAQGKGGKTLADSPTYQEVLASLPASRLGDAYVNIAPLMAEAGKLAPVQLTPDQQRQLEAVRALSLALRVETNGVALDTLALYDPSKLDAKQQALLKQGASPMKVVGALSDQTVFMLTLRDLKGIWQSVRAQMSAEPSFTQGIKQVEAATGLSLDEDIFGWMTGEVALAMTRDTVGFMGDARMPFGGMLLIEAKDRALIEAKMAKIEAVLGTQGLTLSGAKVKGVDFKMTPQEMGGLSAGYGFVGDFLVVGLSRTSLGAAVDASKASLANAATFKAVNETLPKEKTAMIYLDTAALVTMAGSLPPRGDMAEFRRAAPYLRPVKGIGVSSEPLAANNTQRSHLFILVGD